MTKNHPHRIIILVVLLLPFLPAIAQTKVVVKADRNRILIGEPIRLMFEVEIPENEAIGFVNPDTIPHFEILRRDIIDTANTSKGTTLKGSIYITSFDSGHWVIPPLLLRDSIYTDSIPVDVGYTPFDVSKLYNDIKDVIEADAEKKEKKTYWWFFAAGAVVLALVVYFILRKKKKPVVKPVVVEDAYALAIRELDQLGSKGLSKDLYYSGLVNIFRVYVQQRKGIESMHQTTGDLVERLAGIGLPDSLYAELAAALRFSDLVKFARFDASAAEDEQTRATVKKSIQVIEETRQAGLAAAAAGPAQTES